MRAWSRFPFASCLALSAAGLTATALAGCGGAVSSGAESSGEGGAATTNTAGTTAASHAASACTRVPKQMPLLSSKLSANDVYSTPASDGAYVYVGGESTLYRVPVSGGALETVSTDYRAAFGTPAAASGTVVWEVPAAAAQNAGGITIQNASGQHDVAIPSGATVDFDLFVIDAEGDVFFELDLASSASSEVEWWNPSTGALTAVAGVGTPGTAPNLYFADGGQLFWAGTGPSGTGVYATDFATGGAHLLDTPGKEFGSLIGIDATYLYGAGDICPDGACPFTISKTPRDGGAASTAYQTSAAYWTNGVRADATGIYWIDWSSATLFHGEPGASDAPSAVATLGPAVIPSQFGMDDCNVYWVDANGTNATQQIMAAPK